VKQNKGKNLSCVDLSNKAHNGRFKACTEFIELKCNLCSTDKLFGFVALVLKHNGMSRIAVQCGSPGDECHKMDACLKTFPK